MNGKRDDSIISLFKPACYYNIERLYKYRSLENEALISRLERTFTHREIYFPSPSSFNDPFECKRKLEIRKGLHTDRYLRKLRPLQKT
jgi:hypothetical protein